MAGIEKYVDKAWEDKPFGDIASAPVSALQGVSERDGELLAEALGIKTVRDLAENKFVKWAQAITTLSA